MPFAYRPGPDRRQMDCSHHSGARQRNAPIRRFEERDRRYFPEDADPNPAQPRARWTYLAKSLSRCFPESRILAHASWANTDRSVARALPMVGETLGRTTSEPKPGAIPGEIGPIGRQNLDLGDERSAAPLWDAGRHLRRPSEAKPNALIARRCFLPPRKSAVAATLCRRSP